MSMTLMHFNPVLKNLKLKKDYLINNTKFLAIMNQMNHIY